ncbi:unnamed protein product [Schistosoma rodhaini]|uniref:Uncharacterized protein n=1 Tax=Schistosoma rodhaini TaxID=6188 RepID=A0AA85FUD7_9TREM|nr:unnamed protein product [Schistosoma rodhaini]
MNKLKIYSEHNLSNKQIWSLKDFIGNRTISFDKHFRENKQEITSISVGIWKLRSPFRSIRLRKAIVNKH